MSARYDTVVVGAGFAGSILAERLAGELDHRVLVIDKRDHIAGNAYDYSDRSGVLCHRYGPHIFHANNQKIVDYLSRFTDWHPYEHRVLADVDGTEYPFPINMTTVNELYGLSLSDEAQVEQFFAEQAEAIEAPANSEDSIVSRIGRDLYEKFYRGYTRKQWGCDASELDASVCARIPIRFNDDDRYFTDAFQGLPADGYTAMFERMLSAPGIEVQTSTEWSDIERDVDFSNLVYTGPIDEFFGYRFGKLPYRSLRFDLETFDAPDGELRLNAGQVNFPEEAVPFTRKTEFRWLTGQESLHTTIAVEYPSADGPPFYPVPKAETRALYHDYRKLAEQLPNTVFVGRLARYQYLNMDQVVGQALAQFDAIKHVWKPGNGKREALGNE